MTTKGERQDVVRGKLARFLRRLGGLLKRPDRLLTTVALLIGCITGLGAVGFSYLIEAVTHFYFRDVAGELARRDLQWVLLPLLPMSGALLVGLITYYLAPEAEGHGVPEVMDAMARKGGRIRPRVAGAKAVASALTIGSGGAAGTEGPIIQIGAAIGSGFGQFLRMSLADVRVLIGCGAAAGIASIFNAPIAGVLFAVEVLLREVALRSFVPIIIASVLSSVVTQSLRGHNEAIFPIPAQFTGVRAEPIYSFTVGEFFNYLILGLICGVVAVVFVKALYFSEDVFRKLPLHRIFRPVLGAAILGLVAVGSHAMWNERIPETERSEGVTAPTVHKVEPPAIMGNGYPIIKETLEPPAYVGDGRWTIILLVALCVGKILATCLTLGSGGSGGVFAPSLFIGATAGGAFGLAVQQIPFFAHVSPGAYALVGMAAVVASSIHAPLTATLILFELTRDYKVIVPIMTAAVVGLAVAQWIEPASIYTLKLLRRGIRFGQGDLRTLQRISVRDVARLSAPVVRVHEPVDRLVRMMRTTTANDFVVLDERGRVVGMVLGDDLRTILLESDVVPALTVSDVMRDDQPTVHLDETLDSVLAKFALGPMQSLAVVDPNNANGAPELLTRSAVMNRYYQTINGSPPQRA